MAEEKAKEKEEVSPNTKAHRLGWAYAGRLLILLVEQTGIEPATSAFSKPPRMTVQRSPI